MYFHNVLLRTHGLLTGIDVAAARRRQRLCDCDADMVEPNNLKRQLRTHELLVGVKFVVVLCRKRLCDRDALHEAHNCNSPSHQRQAARAFLWRQPPAHRQRRQPRGHGTHRAHLAAPNAKV